MRDAVDRIAAEGFGVPLERVKALHDRLRVRDDAAEDAVEDALEALDAERTPESRLAWLAAVRYAAERLIWLAEEENGDE